MWFTISWRSHYNSNDEHTSEALLFAYDGSTDRNGPEVLALSHYDSTDNDTSEALACSPSRGSLRASLPAVARCLCRRGRVSPLALRFRQDVGREGAL